MLFTASKRLSVFRLRRMHFAAMAMVLALLPSCQGPATRINADHERLGGVQGGWAPNAYGGLLFIEGAEGNAKGLPGFRYRQLPKEKLPDLPVPWGLSLAFSKTTDAELTQLAHLSTLTVLDLDYTCVTDGGLRELAPLTNLAVLGLANTDVSGAGLKSLAPFANLNSLRLKRSKVTAADLKELAPCKKLTLLELDDKQLTDDGLRILHELGLLHTLADLSRGVRPKSAREVGSVDLRGYPITDRGLKELRSLENLTGLALDGTKITSVGLKELSAFSKLASLDIVETNVTDAGLDELAAHKNLVRLNLHNTKVTEKAVQRLREKLPLTAT